MSDDAGNCIICGELVLHGMEYCEPCARELYGPPDWEQIRESDDPWAPERID